jgi:hypothetical protein
MIQRSCSILVQYLSGVSRSIIFGPRFSLELGRRARREAAVNMRSWRHTKPLRGHWQDGLLCHRVP